MTSDIDFHEDAHPEAKEITGNANYGEWGQCVAASQSKDRRCHHHAQGPHGKCGQHGAKTPTKEENEDVGASEGNDNAVTHGAFREFFAKSLTNEEAQAVRQAEQLLEDTNDAQQVGRTAASLCLIQYNRTGDERFMRRFESICDTFEIAPEDVQKHEHSGELEHSGGFEVNISRHRVTEEDLEDETDE